MKTSGTWSAKITAIIAQNQICFLKFQRILMATAITPRTITTANPTSSLPFCLPFALKHDSVPVLKEAIVSCAKVYADSINVGVSVEISDSVN